MRRHVIEQIYNKHLGQQYGTSFGKAYESEVDAEDRLDRDTEERWSRKADWNNDLNQNTTPERLLRRGNASDFYGKGPRNYQRKDADIREDVCEALWLSPAVDPGETEVTVEDGIVTLSGTVVTRSAKKLTENIADSIPGVRDVVNRLTIKKD